MVEDRYARAEKIYREPGDAVEGGKLLIYCRKKANRWTKVRASEQHHYFKTTASMSALAIIEKTFKHNPIT